MHTPEVEHAPKHPNCHRTVPRTNTMTALLVRHDVDLRSVPCIWGSIRLRTIAQGERLRVVERVNSSWFQVCTTDGCEGFVLAHPYFVSLGQLFVIALTG